eukprot:gene4137-20320_t
MKFGFAVAGLVCLLSFAAAEDAKGRIQCQRPPVWKVDGIDPMAEARGSVVVLTLLKAS